MLSLHPPSYPSNVGHQLGWMKYGAISAPSFLYSSHSSLVENISKYKLSLHKTRRHRKVNIFICWCYQQRHVIVI